MQVFNHVCIIAHEVLPSKIFHLSLPFKLPSFTPFFLHLFSPSFLCLPYHPRLSAMCVISPVLIPAFQQPAGMFLQCSIVQVQTEDLTEDIPRKSAARSPTEKKYILKHAEASE
ncbi:hypothetical protein AMECASPLE_006890 [Ameca splendens]|uniref:Uncharacterized protein n=1 Tax=Ameca splendens TaxID=208324 RepID=A0ABV0XNK7_9TELE